MESSEADDDPTPRQSPSRRASSSSSSSLAASSGEPQQPLYLRFLHTHLPSRARRRPSVFSSSSAFSSRSVSSDSGHSRPRVRPSGCSGRRRDAESDGDEADLLKERHARARGRSAIETGANAVDAAQTSRRKRMRDADGAEGRRRSADRSFSREARARENGRRRDSDEGDCRGSRDEERENERTKPRERRSPFTRRQKGESPSQLRSPPQRSRRSRSPLSLSSAVGSVYTVESDSAEDPRTAKKKRKERKKHRKKEDGHTHAKQRSPFLARESQQLWRKHFVESRSAEKSKRRSPPSGCGGRSEERGPHDRSCDGRSSEEKESRGRECPGDLPPRAPRNPLFAAYDRESYRELRRRQESCSSRRVAEGTRGELDLWCHDRFHARSPSPKRLRPPSVWDTRRGQWRSLAGGVYVPPRPEEIAELEKELARYKPSPREWRAEDRGAYGARKDRKNGDRRDASRSPVRRGSPVYE
ncbi:hypothetical protein BESB_038070 [Besnoitia besnoiti]|uniref:Uncharacterized protein n=1 Tax=Besnoitia besnoiti TaxID=94643 RepID=A0A2A9MHH6_BESBE|nr:hypothetical protein BESB_038070 [Besnoitia besnoiti]PFH37349.1 hypothetical protein BESB_038070 [Besnoitia besnoiti]